MKTIYTFLLLCIITFQIENVKSQTTVTLESASNTSRSYNLGSYWGFQRSVNLYTSAEIGTTNVSITSIQVNVATAGSASIPIKIYMKTQAGGTITSSQTWSAVTTGATLVYNSNVTFNSTGWATIDITDYSYLSDNLLIYFESNYGGSGAGSNSPYFWYGGSTNKQKYWYDDYSAPTGTEDGSGNRANVKITYNSIASSPIVTTTAISSIAPTSASSGGNITSIGSAAVSVSGICWNTATDPTTSNSKTTDGATTATSFSSNLSGLSAQTYYYVRAYATNSVGTSYGSNVGFYTYSTEPTGHSGTFTATAAGPNQIDLSFSAASGYGADGYLILGYAGSSAPSSSGVVDGVASGSFSLTSPVTVITNITGSSTTSFSHSSVVSNTQYYYIIIPYNWDGTNAGTYNYLTAATIPSATATTPVGPSAEGMYIAGNVLNNGTIISTNDDNYFRMTGTSKTLSGTGTFTNTKLFVDGTITFTGTFAGGAMTETFVNTSKSLDVATAKTFKNGLFTNYGTLTLTGIGVWENTGNYLNYSTVTAASGSTTVFNGSSTQTINGTANSTFGNVTMNNSAGLTVSKGFTVNTVLTFTSGNITAASSSEAVTFETSGTASGAADTKCIVGYCKKNTNSTTKFTFPIGTSTLYRSAAITPSGTAVTTWTAKYFGTGYGTYTVTGGSIYQPSKREYWTIDRSGVSASNATIELSWGSNSNVYAPNTSDLIVAHFNGTAWENAGGNSISGSTTGVVSSNAGWSSYSPFTLGSQQYAVTLPITLVSFDAKPYHNDVKVSWQTASEVDNDYFTVERSENGVDFFDLARVDGAGNSAHTINYFTMDTDFNRTVLYYRLKLTSFNGEESFSDIASVDMSQTQNQGVIIMTVNSLGQEVDETAKGIVFDIYSDGTSVKRIQF
jgi:hypothetical protein